jgi:hypothetical protein
VPTKYTDRRLSSEAIRNLNEIVSYTRSKVVITSNWRLGLTLTQLKIILRSEGFHGDVVGKTDIGVSRGEEILEWIELKGVTDYVVIDDQVGDIISVLGDKRVIEVDHKKGLDRNVVDKAIDILFQ